MIEPANNSPRHAYESPVYDAIHEGSEHAYRYLRYMADTTCHMMCATANPNGTPLTVPTNVDSGLTRYQHQSMLGRLRLTGIVTTPGKDLLALSEGYLLKPDGEPERHYIVSTPTFTGAPFAALVGIVRQNLRLHIKQPVESSLAWGLTLAYGKNNLKLTQTQQPDIGAQVFWATDTYLSDAGIFPVDFWAPEPIELSRAVTLPGNPTASAAHRMGIPAVRDAIVPTDITAELRPGGDYWF